MKTMALRLFVMLIILLIPFASTHTSTMLYAGLSNSEKSDVKAASEQLGKGEQIFSSSCRVCHAHGGNVINPSLPLRGSQKLADFKTFLSFIRNPRMPDGSTGSMPSFPRSQLSNGDVMKLYNYLVAKYGLNRGN